jgi:hypothetical protein
MAFMSGLLGTRSDGDEYASNISYHDRFGAPLGAGDRILRGKIALGREDVHGGGELTGAKRARRLRQEEKRERGGAEDAEDRREIRPERNPRPRHILRAWGNLRNERGRVE